MNSSGSEPDVGIVDTSRFHPIAKRKSPDQPRGLKWICLLRETPDQLQSASAGLYAERQEYGFVLICDDLADNMPPPTTNTSLGRSRSLKIPASSNLKPTSSTSQVTSGPSYVSLFLTNLRLLDLDLREDWPDIAPLKFSTKDVLQNQKRRIQSVEWALFHLFALWDPDETRNVIQSAGHTFEC